MPGDVPAGFARVSLGAGFSLELGDLFADTARGRLGWRVGERHVNPVGMCHGGALATFADAQLVAHYGDVEGWPAHLPTISLSVDYLAPIPCGAWVEAEVAIDRLTRTMIFTRALITAAGSVSARSSAIYRNITRTGDPQ